MTTIIDARNVRDISDFPDEVADGWHASFLSKLNPSSAGLLLADARLETIAAGSTFYRGISHAETQMVAVVARGQLRMYILSADGRQATVQYASRGAVVGLPAALLTGGQGADGRALEQFRRLGGEALNGEALRDTTILRIEPSALREAMRRDSDLSFAIALYLAERLSRAHNILTADLLLPVRSRVARHLLTVAQGESGALVVRGNHQSIADACGSAREVVSRILKRMEREGLVAKGGGAQGHLRVLDLRGLRALALSR
jgi:CRP/FNR family transcriptional regulator, anaerobic regulatory protein